MGYRSEEFIKVDLKHKDELNQILKENNLLDCFETTNDKNYYYAYGSWLKFYEEYRDVDALINFIEDDEEEDSKAMLAIGEDNAITYWGAYSQIDLWAVCDIDSDYFPIQELR